MTTNLYRVNNYNYAMESEAWINPAEIVSVHPLGRLYNDRQIVCDRGVEIRMSNKGSCVLVTRKTWDKLSKVIDINVIDLESDVQVNGDDFNWKPNKDVT